MRYVTGLHALNSIRPDPAPSDWHRSAIDWGSPLILESEGSPFGDWGIVEACDPLCDERLWATNLRACADLIALGRFGDARGMREHFIGDDAHEPELFEMVSRLRGTEGWGEVDRFMGSEYMLHWLDFKEGLDG